MPDNELTELHPDKQLALRIENGEVSREEVMHVWEETRDLSAQTDFDTRRAVVALRKCGSLNDAWPVFFTQLTEMMSQMRGAMTSDHSKFAHLVAGTEAIVKAMQNINPLAARLEQIQLGNQEMNCKLDEIIKKITGIDFSKVGAGPAPVASEPHPPTIRRGDAQMWLERKPIHAGACDRCETLFSGDYNHDICEHCGAGGLHPKPIKFIEGMGWVPFTEPAEPMDWEQRDEQARKETIGSAWAK